MSGGILKHACEQGDRVGDYVCHLDGWTTEPPTEPGWYWVKHKRHTDVFMVSVAHDDDKVLTVYSDGYPVPADNLTHWLGPLPPPEPPK
jgi:hypothetical protein